MILHETNRRNSTKSFDDKANLKLNIFFQKLKKKLLEFREFSAKW